MRMTSLLVGAFARKAAGMLLVNLPTGTQLLLSPEPENPYDPGAIKVLVEASQVPLTRQAEVCQALEAFGMDWEDLQAEPIFLGYVAAQEGKPLREAQKAGEDFRGNRDFAMALSALDDEGPYQGTLGFAASGKPTVTIQVGD